MWRPGLVSIKKSSTLDSSTLEISPLYLGGEGGGKYWAQIYEAGEFYSGWYIAHCACVVPHMFQQWDHKAGVIFKPGVLTGRDSYIKNQISQSISFNFIFCRAFRTRQFF